jgi:predicted Fe-Mo cluster-binding NifX family protein
MRTQTTDDQDTLRFRAPTLEEAVAVAEQSLGTRVRVLAANRIRRGGIGGFFASDLGIEVIVTPDSETVEDALERLINDSAKEERFQWQADRGAVPANDGSSSDAPLDMPGRRWLLEQTSNLPAATAQAIQDALADGSSHAERRARRRTTVDIDPSDPATNTSSWWEPPEADRLTGATSTTSSQVASFDDIVAQIDRVGLTDTVEHTVTGQRTGHTGRDVDVIDVLSALAGSRDDGYTSQRAADIVAPAAVEAAPVVAIARAAAPQPAAEAGTVESPGLIRVEKIIEELQALTASPRLLTVMKQRQAQEAAAEVARSRQSLLGTPRHHPTDAEHPVVVSAPDQRAIDVDAHRMHESVDVSIDLVADLDADVDASSDETSAGALHTGPSQRQVELAVAAADQLIDSLSREDGVKRLSVRIVLRTAGHDEVEAGAEWESKA